MTTKRLRSAPVAALLICLCACATAAEAPVEKDAPGKSKALLEKVQQQDMDRQINARKTEMDRLNEDLTKTKTAADSLQQTIDATVVLAKDSSDNLQNLQTEKQRLQHSLAVVAQRINAERLRTEGLGALNEAQTKSRAALDKHVEEIDLATRVQAEESKLISEGKPLPNEDTPGQRKNDLVQLRRSLESTTASTATQERSARLAMKAAKAKIESADAAAAKATELASQPAEGLPAPIAEKTHPAKKKTPRKSEEPAPPKAKAVGTATPAPNAPDTGGLFHLFPGSKEKTEKH